MTSTALARRKHILLLGAIDMEHVIAAATAIEREENAAIPDHALIRALETALVVCYWRPFSSSNRAGHLRDSDALDPELHGHMRTLRNQAHAHIDTASGRRAGVTPPSTSRGMGGFVLTESWWSFPQAWLPRVIDVAERQRDAFRAEAMSIPDP